uniref:Signal recognition particle receptor subunit beta n=1 Tax=Petromyzon marinus TaxID=7757 RepID=A0AAJ7XHF3_PETMA|nr:signal recognition particle receptor subunit beta isoform X2 [Petromyzon marinus]
MAGAVQAPWWSSWEAALLPPPPAAAAVTPLGLLVALLVLVLTLGALWFARRGREARRSVVLLLGPSNAGKTLMFIRLLTGTHRDTHMSFEVNSAPYQAAPNKGVVTLVDVPGHASVRVDAIERLKHGVRAVVVVVDSVAFQKEVKEVAETLYAVLTDKALSRPGTPVLIACNKQDIGLAKSASLIKMQLEKELTTLRVTQAAALSSTTGRGGGGGGGALGGGGPGGGRSAFSFSQLGAGGVEFTECDARSDGGLSSVVTWLTHLG